MDTVAELNHSSFAELEDRKFRIYHESDTPVEIELVEVGELIETKRQQMFSILFEIPKDCVGKQGLYKMEHDKLGTIELLLVPVMSDEDRRYEAVFNRLKKKGS